MSLIKDGIMVVLSSPSGAGKTTLVRKIAEQKKFSISVSHTTRTPRSNEVDGEDYYFVKEENFKSLIKQNEFLEHAKVFDNYYGTSKNKVFENLNKGNSVIFDIDWQGTQQIKIKKLNFELITFFILPPSKEELFKRLSNREGNDETIVKKRMNQFDQDLLHWKDYDFVVINDNLNICFNEIINLIDLRIKKKKIDYDKKKIEDHIKILK